MAGRKELFCASTSPVIISALHITPAALKQFFSFSLLCHSGAVVVPQTPLTRRLRDNNCSFVTQKRKSFRKSFRRAADVIWRAENPTGLVEAQKSSFLPLERFLFQCARFSFLDAHSSLWSSSSSFFLFFQNHSIATQGKKVFFPTFFPGFLEWAFHPGLILKTFSKGKKMIFCIRYWK